ncbi:uncharacterized protein LOC128200852 [Galleria mellonella]|uniref:Uncharacterized protein LOC128200852 n=1 Tax=Galleria mellonella TaxID=7137 RepID=A0ABM3MJH1_GALME|nr:uncharacterized protein LOC128200852 [Galleria mellonella]
MVLTRSQKGRPSNKYDNTMDHSKSGQSNPTYGDQGTSEAQCASTSQMDAPPEGVHVEPPPRSRGDSHTASRRSTGSMVKARLLAAEAEHARRLAELERKVADAELRAQLAAIEAESSVHANSYASSCMSSKQVETWLNNNPGDGPLAEEPIDRQTGISAPEVPASHSLGLPFHPTTSHNSVSDPQGQKYTGSFDAQFIGKAISDLGAVLTSNKSNNCHTKLPLFDGSCATEWLSFKRTFVDTEKFYSAGENLARLNGALRGAAREAVHVLLVSARDPQQVISALETRFGCPEMIMLQELNSVRALPKVSSEGKDLDVDIVDSDSSTSQSDKNQIVNTRRTEECAVEVSAHATTTFLNTLSRSLLKIIAVRVSGPSGTVNTYALLDDGCTTTLIDAKISKHIGAVGPKGRVHIDCLGGLSKIADELCYENAQPTIVIGIDNCHLTVPKLIRAGTATEPMAIKTALGWVVCGPISKSKIGSGRDIINHATVFDDCQSDNIQNFEEIIKEHYRLDSFVKKEYRDRSDAHALKILESTVRRLPDGHFEAGLLWRPDISVVPNNYRLALSRFLSLEKKMKSDNQYAQLYRLNVHAMIDKGYVEECHKSPIGISWYLPHFGVTHPHKSGKLRIVHDAAAKFQGVSLNSLLLPGPDLLQPLLGILMRFREGPIALTADIREMFPQVKIREQDRDAQRFLWRDYHTQEIKIYRMSSMMFGACSSPCTALYVKKVNADEFPEAAHASVFDTYMDDYIGSQDNIEKAARLAADIVELNKRAGFEMRGWASNNPDALALLSKDLVSTCIKSRNESIDLGNSNNDVNVRTLGLIWQPNIDTISFSIGFENDKLPHQITKRDALSYVMRIYDHLGILGPIVSRGRIMFQNIWRKRLTWDDELPQTDLKIWHDWFQDLKLVSNLKISRYYGLSEPDVSKRELHIFCDASEMAYAAVAYWRMIFTNGDVKVVLISSKCRVVPLKPTSIPRLELQGALVAARLASFIVESHNHKPTKRFFWTDSLNVLGWLRSDARTYKPFVAHRLGEILELTLVNEWRWVPTHSNVADDATRVNRIILTQSSRWLVGPNFLYDSESSWPSSPPVSMAGSLDKNDVELKPSTRHHSCFVNLITSQPSPMPLVVSSDRLSSWLRLLRATARAHKLITLLRRKGTSDITAEDLSVAETHLLQHSQLETFTEELVLLKNGQPLPRKSKLFTLSPVIDEQRVIRLKGRIDRAIDVEDHVKRPIILDARHRTVRLLIAYYHEKAAHGNTELVVNELRQFYWIIHLRSAVRSVAYNCRVCKIRRATPYQPPMGDLPAARVAHHKRPVSFTGLDYFGPLQVAVGRRREKRYVALFTCLVTRAVHLELVHSLSIDASIMSLRRFIGRRGVPTEIWSDNGTAFVGANHLLKSLYGAEMELFAANECISWKFIPPSAPFMGGSWERLVRSVKNAMQVTLKERTPSDEILLTLLIEAEALINSRPLTHVPSDPDQSEALTPFHFILGTSSGKPIPARIEDRDLCSRAGWQRALRLADHFWSRWVKEYLPTLLPRRGQGIAPRVNVGDLVLVVDDQQPRGTWLRGVITAIYRGQDSIARIAEVRTPIGLFRRPMRKLVPLPT